MLNFKALGVCFMLGTSLAFAQSTAPQSARPAFEVASIRPSGAMPQAGAVGGVRITKGQFHSAFMSLKDYVAVAYGVKLYQVSGPDWMSSARFDISATIPESDSASPPITEMLQTLLTERFGIRMHREKRDFPVYVLEIAKGGLKIQPVQPLPDEASNAPFEVSGGGSQQGVSINLGRGSSITFGSGRFDALRLDMTSLADTLERFVDRPIINRTNLQDRYTFGFPVTPEDYRVMMVRAGVAAGVPLPPEALRLLEGASPAAVFDELRKLGLNIVPRTDPLDLIVVDHIEKAPTEN
jgi:uncharacterized protein (TIGR03435 family)